MNGPEKYESLSRSNKSSHASGKRCEFAENLNYPNSQAAIAKDLIVCCDPNIGEYVPFVSD